MNGTIKLKNFEFSAIVGNPDDSQQVCQANAFDTPNGFVFVLAVSQRTYGEFEQTCEIINQRAQYYLETEVVDDPTEAVANTMVYINGFLFEKKRKDPNSVGNHAGLLCVVFKDQMVYYSWIGDASVSLYTGKKIIHLTGKGFPAKDFGLTIESTHEGLGVNKHFEPFVSSNPIVPIDGDFLLLTVGGVISDLRDNQLMDLLADRMPTHTKAQKLHKLISASPQANSAATTLINFYNLEQSKRIYAPVKPLVASSADKVADVASVKSRLWKWRYLLIIVGVLLASYIIYDLFLFNPATPTTETITTPATPAEEVPHEAEVPPAAATVQPELPQPTQAPTPALPEDVSYTVVPGDTWNRIYQRFSVCSWFIRNHPPNQGRFDGDENPIANSVLMIPVKFSASRRLNPNFYREFSLDRVGNACQNANEEFVRQFMSRASAAN